MSWPREWSRDPRHFQIAALGSLLVYGISVLGFSLSAGLAGTIVATALATQWVGNRLDRRPYDPRSALVSALSLCLLLRTDAMALAAGTAALAIGSKFVLRRQGRHLFNPTAFALVVMAATWDGVWISPGQWGHAASFLLGVTGLGLIVLTRAARLDITAAFVGAYAALTFGRALWLGDPTSIPLHHLSNGALLLFAFFMISDPRTTPARRGGRIAFAVAVAATAAAIEFLLYRPNGLLIALVACAPLVPLIDGIAAGVRLPRWRAPLTAPIPFSTPRR